MQSGKVVTPDGIKESIKRLLNETLTDALHCSFLLRNGKKKHFSDVRPAGDAIDNSEKLNHIILNNDSDLIKKIIVEIILDGPAKKMMSEFEERITSYPAIKVYEEALTLIPDFQYKKSRFLFERLHLISKGVLIENPKNHVEQICNILTLLKKNKDKIAHSTIRKYVDTVDNDKKQECLQAAIIAIEKLLLGEITAKRLISALQKLNSFREANQQLTANSFFSKPGKTDSTLFEAYQGLFGILNDLKGEELKVYFSPSV